MHTFSPGCRSRKFSLFPRVVAIGLVTALGSEWCKTVLSGPIFSEAGDFGEKVPVCNALKSNAEFSSPNCRFQSLAWAPTMNGIELFKPVTPQCQFPPVAAPIDEARP
jgi:hypothetical protein